MRWRYRPPPGSPLAPSRVPRVRAPFIMNFMLEVPEGPPLAGHRDLLRDVGGWDDNRPETL